MNTQTASSIPAHLVSKELVCQAPNGGWFITMGNAGFNSPTNNRSGYKTKEAAIKAHQKYSSR